VTCTLHVSAGHSADLRHRELLDDKPLISIGPAWHDLSLLSSEMFSWAVTILILAVLAGVLAFWGVAGLPKWLVRGLCLLFIILFIIAVVFA
jgi:uncharacterized membrane protein YtjA (UPF0391 family)